MQNFFNYHILRLQVIAVRLTLGYKLTDEQEQEWINSSQEEQYIACETINNNRGN